MRPRIDGSPRRLRGRAALGPWALALTLGAGSGCREDEPPPVEAARRYAHAAGMGDVEGVLAMVDARTVARVRQAAERASDQVGGRRSVEPREMLQVVDVDPRFQVVEAELVQGGEERATVRLRGTNEVSHTLELIFEDGSWRVELPLPRAPMAGPSAEPAGQPTAQTTAQPAAE